MIERILILDRDEDFCENLKNKLELSGSMLVDTVTSIEMLREIYDNRYYNVLIAELELLDRQDIEYIKNHQRLTAPFYTDILLMSERGGADAVLDIGVGKEIYCFKKPFEFSMFNKVLNDLILSQATSKKPVEKIDEDIALERSVTSVMHALGIPAHIKGYQFLRTAIIKAVKDPEIINYITKSLYPEVAKAHLTTSSRVERAIRHAIEVAWDRGDVDTLNSYFGYTISRQRGKPTNSEFIAMISDNLRMRNSEKMAGILNDEYNLTR